MTAEQTQITAALRSFSYDRSGVLILGVAVVYATVEQGAFYPGTAALVLLMVGLSAVCAIAGRRRPQHHVLATVGLLLILALWTTDRAGDGLAGLRAGLPVAAVAAAVWAVAGLGGRARDVLTAVLAAAGLLVAASGWVGVVWHVEPLALVSSGLWRASSTLSYANATAAFLVIAIFRTAAEERLGLRCSRLVVAALLVGLLATMSRAGLLGLGGRPARRGVLARVPAQAGGPVARASLRRARCGGPAARPGRRVGAASAHRPHRVGGGPGHGGGSGAAARADRLVPAHGRAPASGPGGILAAA